MKISAERTDKQNGKYSKDNQLLWMINSVPNCRVFKSDFPDYYPGWHELGTMLEMIMNKTKLNELPRDL